MSDLTFIERKKIEGLLNMESGYVLDFTNRTFAEFIGESIGINIYDQKYEAGGSSKANRLRTLFGTAPNHVVGKLLKDIVAYAASQFKTEASLRAACEAVAERLLKSAPVPDLETVVSVAEGRDFELIAKSVKEAIERNSPETGLDRLHTFVVKYVRTISEKRGISVDRDKPLHSIFGEYIKRMKALGFIESEMTERILKSSISIMEYFNRVRNEQSLAHDNPILNHSESLLIFNHITSAIRFVQALEDSADARMRAAEPTYNR